MKMYIGSQIKIIILYKVEDVIVKKSNFYAIRMGEVNIL